VIPVSLRRATVDDAPGIGLVHVRSWQAAYRAEVPAAYLTALDPEARGRRWARILNESEGTTFVTEAEGAICGFCGVCANRDADLDSSVSAEIAALYVHPDSWRSGYGRSLCRAALSCAREHDFREVTLWVLESNQRARRFYEAHDFLPDGAAKAESHESGVTLSEVRYRCSLAGAA
jgi:ribosomal protein S18 acetylase RimI-like enzyme